MADMLLVYRVMPEDGDVEYSKLEEVTRKTVEAYDEKVSIKEIGAQDVGFGLQACKVKFQMDENLGSENLENNLKDLPQVGDVIIELMDRL